MALSLQTKIEWLPVVHYQDGKITYLQEKHPVAERIKIDRVLNVSGLLSPHPSLITAKKLEDMNPGEILEVVCSDKCVKVSIPALCRQGHYELVETREEKGRIHFIIRK
jgi:tRNA 2-thiouridine synthesizing protein A